MKGRKTCPSRVVPTVGKGKGKGSNVPRTPPAHGGSCIASFPRGSSSELDSNQGAFFEGPRGGGHFRAGLRV